MNQTHVKMVDRVTTWALGTSARVLSVLREARVKVCEYVIILLRDQMAAKYYNETEVDDFVSFIMLSLLQVYMRLWSHSASQAEQNICLVSG